MLEIKHVNAGYNGLTILFDINFEVPDQKLIAIVGSNGAGKSTLLKCITGLIKPMQGEVVFDGQPISSLPPHKILECGVSMVPEGRQLFPQLTVMENLEIGSTTKEPRKRRPQNLEKVFTLFPRLKEREKQYAGTLSGGEQQMLAMGRSLMSSPKLLILDEPSWGLAPLLVKDMFNAILAIRNEGTAILIVEQNVYMTLDIADWGYVVEQGRVVMQGAGKELLKDPNLKKAYLGM